MMMIHFWTIKTLNCVRFFFRKFLRDTEGGVINAHTKKRAFPINVCKCVRFLFGILYVIISYTLWLKCDFIRKIIVCDEENRWFQISLRILVLRNHYIVFKITLMNTFYYSWFLAVATIDTGMFIQRIANSCIIYANRIVWIGFCIWYEISTF